LTPERWQRAREVFEAALAHGPEERDSFVVAACGADAELLAEVRKLLLAHDEAGSFLDKPVIEAETDSEPTRRQPSTDSNQLNPPHAPAAQQARRAYPSNSPSGGRFVAGTMLAGRYRIVGLLGRGGMGEVYKAEDLKLNQPVALKFLPESLALDGAMLARFHNEVRTARQITHPNVCRVHDIGEAAGLHFLSMEFIDGEDLSSLLRRIGRLPGDKAVELARQICAGLAAAHEAGVLHRDLKPANVMIDGRGRARITDFGLAVVSAELSGAEVLAGTPAYMAPEQLTGKEATPKSDLYALGLVLYELFTGKRAYEAKSVGELIRLREQSTPPTPSSHVKEIDPLAERVIMRCLEKEAHKRPSSAVQVALALPGGDPLQAALAAGETPSPEMIAAAGGEAGLRPAVAVACLVAVIVGLITAAWVNGKTRIIHRLPFDNPPEVLAHKAREIAAQLGYPNQPADQVWDFAYNTDYLRYVEKAPSPTRWNNLQPQAILFRYRESPRHFQTAILGWQTDLSISRYLPTSPSGMINLGLDPQGRLLWFSAVPPRVNEAVAITPDWDALLRAAGLDPTRFTQSEPQWTPPSAFDARIAWTETSLGEQPGLARVEAASWRGRPVYFEIVYPWTKLSQAEVSAITENLPASGAVFYLPVLIAVVMVARWNYRRGQGDHLGAFKLASLILSLYVLTNVLSANYAPPIQEKALTLLRALIFPTFAAACSWLFYFAFEPYVRRYWPTTLISWSRIMTGRLRDTLVGRDVLIGILGGVAIFLLSRLRASTSDYLHEVIFGAWDCLFSLIGMRMTGSVFAVHIGDSFTNAIMLLFTLFLLRALLRRQWLAAVITILALTFNDPVGRPNMGVISICVGALYSTIFVFIGVRFGFVALVCSLFANGVLHVFPLALNFSAWYAGTEIFALLAVLSVAVWGFHTSLGGRKVFQGGLLEE
jgi:hypothetical protein